MFFNVSRKKLGENLGFLRETLKNMGRLGLGTSLLFSSSKCSIPQ